MQFCQATGGATPVNAGQTFMPMMVVQKQVVTTSGPMTVYEPVGHNPMGQTSLMMPSQPLQTPAEPAAAQSQPSTTGGDEASQRQSKGSRSPLHPARACIIFTPPRNPGRRLHSHGSFRPASRSRPSPCWRRISTGILITRSEAAATTFTPTIFRRRPPSIPVRS